MVERQKTVGVGRPISRRRFLVLGALPLIIVFLFFQRRIVRGIAGTGLKG